MCITKLSESSFHKQEASSFLRRCSKVSNCIVRSPKYQVTKSTILFTGNVVVRMIVQSDSFQNKLGLSDDEIMVSRIFVDLTLLEIQK